MRANPIDLIQEGDQVQLFQGDFDPTTGAAREMMVVFGPGEIVRYSGPVDQAVLDDPRTHVRDIKLHIPLGLMNNFVADRNPLLRKKRVSSRGRTAGGAQASLLAGAEV